MIQLRPIWLLAVYLVFAAAHTTEARADGLHTTPSIAVACLVRDEDGAEASLAVDLRLEALHGDSTRPRVGGFVDGRVTSQSEPSVAAGLAVALPTSARDRATTFVLASGVALHARDDGTVAAGLARLSWGLRIPPDASKRYELAVGVWAEARYFPGERSVDVLVGVSADFYALTLPFRLLGSAFR